MSSDHQNPIGQPVCSETAGFDATIAIRFGRSGLRMSIAPAIFPEATYRTPVYDERIAFSSRRIAYRATVSLHRASGAMSFGAGGRRMGVDTGGGAWQS